MLLSPCWRIKKAGFTSESGLSDASAFRHKRVVGKPLGFCAFPENKTHKKKRKASSDIPSKKAIQ
jgi:hypothetical protein